MISEDICEEIDDSGGGKKRYVGSQGKRNTFVYIHGCLYVFPDYSTIDKASTLKK